MDIIHGDGPEPYDVGSLEEEISGLYRIDRETFFAKVLGMPSLVEHLDGEPLIILIQHRGIPVICYLDWSAKMDVQALKNEAAQIEIGHVYACFCNSTPRTPIKIKDAEVRSAIISILASAGIVSEMGEIIPLSDSEIETIEKSWRKEAAISLQN